MHALDRVGCRLGNHDPGAGRSGKADHFNIRVRRNSIARQRSIALHQVEDTRRHARCMQDFGENCSISGTFLTRLQHHAVSRSKRRSNLQCNLVERPVPRCDHPDDTDWLIHNARRANHFRKREFTQCLCREPEMRQPGIGLGGRCE